MTYLPFILFAPLPQHRNTGACGDDLKVSESEGYWTLAMSAFAFFLQHHTLISILERDLGGIYMGLIENN